MDWHDPDYVKWACEQIGVDYVGLPLTHAQKQRFIALSQKSHLNYPGPPNKRNIMSIPKPPFTKSNPETSVSLTETALLGQYDKEISSLEASKVRWKRQIDEANVEIKLLIKKRAALSKILGV